MYFLLIRITSDSLPSHFQVTYGRSNYVRVRSSNKKASRLGRLYTAYQNLRCCNNYHTTRLLLNQHDEHHMLCEFIITPYFSISTDPFSVQ